MLGIAVHRVEEGEVGAALGAARLGRLAATGEDPADVCTRPRRLASFAPRASRRWPPTTTPIGSGAKLYPALKEACHVNAPAEFFDATAPIAYGGPEAASPLAFRWYDKDRIVLGKRMEDHLRFAVCYWHSFCWPGGDPFGGETFLRPWHHGADPMALARAKADVAFELFRLLDVPFFTFHDVDVAPEGATLAESDRATSTRIADLFEQKMAAAKVRLLWGTANLFSHRRYMAGAATNPDPEVFAYAAGAGAGRRSR